MGPKTFYLDENSMNKLAKIRKYLIDNSLIKNISMSEIIRYLIKNYYNLNIGENKNARNDWMVKRKAERYW